MKFLQLVSFMYFLVEGSVYKISNIVTRSQQRSQSLNSLSTKNDKEEVVNYFNSEGFSRWNKIYSDSDEVNVVQRDIREGHQQTIDKVLGWLENENNIKNTLCDCGCGVG